MNYRHGFHAGNFADVMKHAALASWLAYLARKEAPFAVIDTHGGAGLYDLSGEAALRTGEARAGALRLPAEADAPAALGPYLQALAPFRRGGALTHYPGSPLIARHFLRAKDRLTVCELHEDEHAALLASVRGDARIAVRHGDGYRALLKLVPPPQKRGLVLLDPPFEAADEFVALAKAVMLIHARWPQGGVLAWYPIKSAQAVAAFHGEILNAGIGDVLTLSLYVRAEEGGAGLAGSGLLAVNAPYTFESEMGAALDALAPLLAQGPGARASVSRLAGE